MAKKENIPALVPTPKKVKLLGGSATLPVGLDCAGAPGECVASWMELYRSSVVEQSARASGDKLAVHLDAGIEGGDEAYRITLTDSPRLEANTEKGIVWGIQTLAQLARAEAADGRLPALEIHDWPAVPWRGFQLDLARKMSYRPEFVKRLVRELSALKYNVLQLYIEHNFAWDAFPELHEADAMSPDDARELDEYAAQYGVTIIPATNICRHMEGFLLNPRFRHLKELPLAKHPVPGGMLHMAHPEAWGFVRTILDEMLDAFSSEHFHIGFDETHYIGRHPKSLRKSPRKWFADWIIRTKKHVEKAGRRSHIWGDKFLLKEEFPNLANCNGGWPGDIREAIDDIPRDLIIQDWHYYSSGDESVKFFREKGFEVWAGGMIQSRPHFICDGDLELMPLFYQNAIAAGANGVIATSWGYSAGFDLWDRLISLGVQSDAIWSGAAPDQADFERRWTRIRYDRPLRIIPLIKSISNEMTSIVDGFVDNPAMHNLNFGETTRTGILGQTDFFDLPSQFPRAGAAGIARLRKAIEKARVRLDKLAESAEDNSDDLDGWNFYIDLFETLCRQLETLAETRQLWRSITAKLEPRVYTMKERRAVLMEIRAKLEAMYDEFLGYLRVQRNLCHEQGMPVQWLHGLRDFLANLATVIQQIRDVEDTGHYPDEPDIFGRFMDWRLDI